MKIDETVKRYLECRDSIAQMKKLLDTKIAPLKEEMAAIEADVLAFLNSSGQESARTKYGTPYKVTTSSIGISDGDSLFKFINENNAADLLQRRINKSAYEQYIEDGVEVPGVKVDKRLTIKIRKN